MSPQVLAMLQAVKRDTQRLAGGRDDRGAVFPRDYYRPAELVKLWNGPGARYFPLSTADASTPSVNMVTA